MSNKDLFESFEAVSLQSWKEKIVSDLKGKDYNETLVWEDLNGISHQPVYHRESIQNTELSAAIQQSQQVKNEWKSIAEEAIEKDYSDHFSKALKDKISISSSTLSEELKQSKKILIDGNFYRQAGANIIQEIAFILQQTVEYLDAGTSNGMNSSDLIKRIDFRLGFGTSYCSEIAKGRAFRYLIQQVYASYEMEHIPTVIGEACNYYHAHKEPYTNLLRISTQAMSAVLANCDFILLPAYDRMEKASSLGERMSQNISHILREESSFSEVRDAAKGSYYIENLSAEIAEKAWSLFLEIEQKGGLISYYQSGELEKALNESHLKRVSAYKNGNEKLLGVNAYTNEASKDLKPETSSNKGIKTYILSTEIS